jgi:hypothetical protein
MWSRLALSRLGAVTAAAFASSAAFSSFRCDSSELASIISAWVASFRLKLGDLLLDFSTVVLQPKTDRSSGGLVGIRATPSGKLNNLILLWFSSVRNLCSRANACLVGSCQLLAAFPIV